MRFNNLITEASQEVVQQFNSFFDQVSKSKEIANYGDLRMREIFFSKEGYIMQFQLKNELIKLSNTDPKIKYIMQLLKDIAIKNNPSAKVRREGSINNQAIIKVIFKDEPIIDSEEK